VPGADDDEGVECEDRVATADDDPFDPALPFEARLYEPPAAISATVARAASGRCFLLIVDSFVW